LNIGAKVPNSGPLALERGVPELARALEEAGFQSLWVSDHIVMPASIESRYPFAADGRATWSPATPYLDAFVALALMAASTERATIGTAALVAPQRNPVELAKQAASVDVASRGRLTLGVGAGWLREEFEALNAPFERRGGRLEEWIEIARSCWTGRTQARWSQFYDLPDDILCLPTPAHAIPILVGGHSRAALHRAGRLGDGWLAQQSLPDLDPAELERLAGLMRNAAHEAGRDAAALQVVLRIVESAGKGPALAERLPELAAAGVNEVIVDVAWDAEEPAALQALLRDAVAA
jgi:probable F420-dependent oxidoreductase